MDENKRKDTSEDQALSLSDLLTFSGAYDHTLDAKGRIVIPNAYREPLGDTFVVSVTRDTKSIALYPNDVFESFIREINSLNKRKVAIQDYIRNVAKFTFLNSQMDNQGRVLLPAKLRLAKLGDAKDIEISGAFDHVEIVSSETARLNYERFNDPDHLDALLEEIGNMGFEQADRS